MDLTKMSRDDLSTLQGRLRTISTAADAMSEGGLEPEVCLTCEETVLRAAPILSRGIPAPLPAPVLVEKVAVDPILVGPAAGRVDSWETPPIVIGGEEVAAEPEPPEEPARELDAKAGAVEVAPDPEPQDAAPQLVAGPLSDWEKSEILRMDRDGETRRDIADALGRKIQTVALFLTSQIGNDGKPRHKVTPPPAADFVHVADAVAPAVDRALAAVAAPPVGPVPVAGPVAELTAREREVWDHLAALRMPKGWDHEMDLDMVEAFARGTKSAVIAADFGKDSQAVVDRYKQLTAVIRDERGHMSIEGQARFQSVLRRFVQSRRAVVA